MIEPRGKLISSTVKPLAIPPPSPPAVLLFTSLLLMVSTPLMGAFVMTPILTLTMPPPEATALLPAAVLPFTCDLFSVIVPWFTGRRRVLLRSAVGRGAKHDLRRVTDPPGGGHGVDARSDKLRLGEAAKNVERRVDAEVLGQSPLPSGSGR